MKVQDATLSIERSGQFAETGFRIKASAKAFSILSSGLYSNKIRAVLRELGTNAADAQVAAGKPDARFRVHLPNNFEPFFSLRDYGTGLSPDAIMQIYTTYFESNKTDSDDFTGCLGLGSKSPFSYTDNFTVVNYFNGAKHSYTAFIGEAGCPTLALLSTEETNEPNGLEVSFAVKPNDFSRFIDEARFVYSYFKVAPEIVGQKVEFAQKKELFGGNGWKLYSGGYNSHIVVMGNVAYPLDLYQVGISNSLFTHYTLEINVKIGEVEMTASREALEYTERTKKALIAYANECVKVFRDNLQKELEAQETLWDACKFYGENALFIGNATWRGQQISSHIKLPAYYPCTTIEKGYKCRVKKFRDVNRIEPSEREIFIENDVRGAVERAKNYLNTNPAAKDVHKIYVLNFAQPEDRQAFLDAVGKLPDGVFIQASTLAKPTVVRTGPATAASQSLEFIPRQKKATSSWEGVEVDLAEGGVYVEIDHWSPTEFGTHENLTEILSILETLGHKTELFGFRKKFMPKIQGDSNWKTLRQYMTEVAESFKSDWEYAVSWDKYNSQSKLLVIKDDLAGLPVADLFNRISYVVDNLRRLQRLYGLLSRLGLEKDIKVTDVAAEVEVITQKYPLVFFILTNCRWDLPGKDIANYIRMVDSKTANVAEVF